MSEKNKKKPAKSVSIISTVFNETDTILDLLSSLVDQTFPPEEIIITDAGSTDGTVRKIEEFSEKNPTSKISLLRISGNRSKGRNSAINHAKNEWIAITDAGCVPEEKWLEELVTEQQRTGCGFIGGFYTGIVKNNFERAVVPYVLVMPDQVNPSTFRPATRSLLLHKSLWSELHGFDEGVDVSEDFDFAIRAEQLAKDAPEKELFQRSFAKKAIVGWYPRKNLSSFFEMVKSMAQDDALTGNMRRKSWLVLARYGLGLGVLVTGMVMENLFITLCFLAVCLLGYCIWAIMKNSKYAQSGWLWLPVLQLSADFGVIIGSAQGLVRKYV